MHQICQLKIYNSMQIRNFYCVLFKNYTSYTDGQKRSKYSFSLVYYDKNRKVFMQKWSAEKALQNGIGHSEAFLFFLLLATEGSVWKKTKFRIERDDASFQLC